MRSFAISVLFSVLFFSCATDKSLTRPSPIQESGKEGIFRDLNGIREECVDIDLILINEDGSVGPFWIGGWTGDYIMFRNGVLELGDLRGNKVELRYTGFQTVIGRYSYIRFNTDTNVIDPMGRKDAWVVWNYGSHEFRFPIKIRSRHANVLYEERFCPRERRSP